MLARRSLLVVLCALALGVAHASPALARDGADRAAALLKNGLTLAKCIDQASALEKGQAVFANVHLGRRGQQFAANVDVVVAGETTQVKVDETGKATKRDERGKPRDSKENSAKIAKAFVDHNTRLAELVNVAEKAAGGVAFNAWGFVDKDKVLVRVLVSVKPKAPGGTDETLTMIVDPTTKKATQGK